MLEGVSQTANQNFVAIVEGELSSELHHQIFKEIPDVSAKRILRSTVTAPPDQSLAEHRSKELIDIEIHLQINLLGVVNFWLELEISLRVGVELE